MKNHWNPLKRIKRALLCAPIVGVLGLGVASAQAAYPDRPITMLVGFSAGGPTDTAGRVLAEFLSQELGQPVVVSNKPGAGGLVAARDLMASSPDGYTLFLVSNGIMTVAPARFEKLDYDPLQDMAAIATVAGYPHILIVPPDSPLTSLADLVALAKEKPGQLNAAQVGNVNELTVEWIKNEADIDVALIPYKGGAAVVSDLTSGRIDFALVAPGVAFPLLDGDRARALGATSDNSFTKKRGIPSFKEAGLGNIDFYIWNGLVAPKGTSPEIINKLSQATQKVLAMPALQEKLGVVFLDAVIGSPDDFKQLIQTETESWKKVVTDANLTPLK